MDLTNPWTPVVNDVVGGWAVVAMDPGTVAGRSLAELEEGSSAGVVAVADFCDEETARHICRLHNGSLDG